MVIIKVSLTRIRSARDNEAFDLKRPRGTRGQVREREKERRGNSMVEQKLERERERRGRGREGGKPHRERIFTTCASDACARIYLRMYIWRQCLRKK